jgi:N-acetylated-alpha-linked acidic dipeptidase
MADAAVSALCSAVDAANLFRHLEEFASRIKLSGTEPERASFEYLQACLDSYGFNTALIFHDAYISVPIEAQLVIGNESPECITHSFSQPSPATGTAGTLVYAGAGQAADFARIDAAGKVVLLDNIANPGASLRASRAGAIGQIHISPHEHLHEMCISPVWGSPTEAQIEQLPRTVVLSVRKAAGDALKARLHDGEKIEVVLHAKVDTGWRKTPLLQADLTAGAADADNSFVMFSGHHDTWHFGVMDNGTANATMLEVGRLAASRRGDMRRSLRLMFWSGHSHGRYTGSAWYAETHWDEIARRCVAHVNIDSVGGRGNTVREDAPASAELFDIAAEAVFEQAGQQLAGHRLSRAGDQSFWGIGIPSMFMGMSEAPTGGANPMAAVMGDGGRKGAGFGWWWHTPDDTIDKIDPEIHLIDTRIYVHAIWRLLADEVLPLNFGRQTAALQREISQLSAALGGVLELAPLQALLEKLRSQLVRPDGIESGVWNRTLMRIARALVPIDYTDGNRFEQGPALPQSAYPALDPIRGLAATEHGSEAAKFAAVAARRALNRVSQAVREAIDAVTNLEVKH